MAKTGEEILDRIKESLNVELNALTIRRDRGREAIEQELDEDRKKLLMGYWDELDNAYKRLLLAHSILTKNIEKVSKISCAVCLGIITEDEEKEFRNAGI